MARLNTRRLENEDLHTGMRGLLGVPESRGIPNEESQPAIASHCSLSSNGQIFRFHRKELFATQSFERLSQAYHVRWPVSELSL